MHSEHNSTLHSIYDGSLRCHITFLFIVVLIPTQLIQLASTPVHRYLSHILFCAMSLHMYVCAFACACAHVAIVCALRTIDVVIIITVTTFFLPLISCFHKVSDNMFINSFDLRHKQNVLFLFLFYFFIRSFVGDIRDENTYTQNEKKKSYTYKNHKSYR